MVEKVKTPYLANFNLPQSCVVCGAPPSYGMNWKVSGSRSNWSGKRTWTLSVEFPICQECYIVSRKKAGVTWVTILAILGVIGICVLIPILSNAVSNGDSIVPFIGIAINIVWIVAMVLWAKHINTKGFTQEQKERRKRVMRSARIRSFNAPNIFDKMGSIVFEFENSNYASQFAILNQGQIQ